MIERIGMNKHTKLRALQKTLVATVIGSFIAIAQASTVIPPPLPTGSTMVKQQVGLHPEEVKRSQRAHHHYKHHKKDVTRDDTIGETK